MWIKIPVNHSTNPCVSRSWVTHENKNIIEWQLPFLLTPLPFSTQDFKDFRTKLKKKKTLSGHFYSTFDGLLKKKINKTQEVFLNACISHIGNKKVLVKLILYSFICMYTAELSGELGILTRLHKGARSDVMWALVNFRVQSYVSRWLYPLHWKCLWHCGKSAFQIISLEHLPLSDIFSQFNFFRPVPSCRHRFTMYNCSYLYTPSHT